jgi:molybdenum cofactor cytidylyltransferase
MGRLEPIRLAAILLAGGSSTRLGQPKQLLRLGGNTLVRRAARLLLELGPLSVTVVTGSQAPRVAREVEDLPLSVVANPAWERGMGASIACGVENLPNDPHGVLILLCDQWRVTLDDLQRLFEVWAPDISKIATASWMVKKSRNYGPPVIFPGIYIQELKFLYGERGAKSLIQGDAGNVRFVRMENARYDLDSPQDLRELEAWREQQAKTMR